MNRPIVRPLDPSVDGVWAEALLDDEFAGRLQARRGELIDALEGEGLVAELDGRRAGLLTWLVDAVAASAEIRILVTLEGARGRGVGGALLDEAAAALRAAGCRTAWVVTTNDATDALALYQRHGFRLVVFRAGAVDEARRTIKPAIGERGERGIPIRDELELELDL